MIPALWCCLFLAGSRPAQGSSIGNGGENESGIRYRGRVAYTGLAAEGIRSLDTVGHELPADRSVHRMRQREFTARYFLRPRITLSAEPLQVTTKSELGKNEKTCQSASVVVWPIRSCRAVAVSIALIIRTNMLPLY